MIMPKDKVVFNDKYDLKKTFEDKNYTVRKIQKICGNMFVWLEEIEGFFPLDSVDLVEFGEL